jgi:hypothetical protein
MILIVGGIVILAYIGYSLIVPNVVVEEYDPVEEDLYL